MSEKIPLQTIGISCGPNPGFVRQMWLIDVKQVEHIPDPAYLFDHNSLLVPSRMISYFSDAKFYNMKFRNKECVFNEALVRGDGGSKFSQAIQFMMPRANVQSNKWLFDSISRRWIVFFQDHLREVRILGSRSVPAEINFNSSLNADHSSSVTLASESTHPSYYTDAMPALERVFSSGFGESFA